MTAGICTSVAFAGELLTRGMLVLTGLRRAHVADLRANAAYFAGKVRLSPHHRHSHAAEFAAILRQLRAHGQLVGIYVLPAVFDAMFTLLGTASTRVHAIL